MLQNGISLTDERKNVYGKLHRVEARLIGYLRRVIRAVQPEDLRPEQEKDIWKLDKLGIDIEENPIYKTDTINFTGILQDGIREEVKQAIYLHLKYKKLGTVKREMSSLRQFSKYLDAQQSRIASCKEIDRALLEEYLIHKATYGSSGRANSDDILKLRSVLESIGKIYGYPHLEKLFISKDIPSEIPPEFKTYSDQELRRLNAHITKLDEQITRCLVIHQGVHAVMHYRKMSNQLLADETRRARAEQTRILRCVQRLTEQWNSRPERSSPAGASPTRRWTAELDCCNSRSQS